MKFCPKKAAALSAAYIICFSLTACGENTGADSGNDAPASETAIAVISDENGFSASLTQDFDSVSDFFEISDGWSNGSMFNCTWRKTNCTFADGKMSLTIDREPEGSKPPYSGAEFRTKDFYGFGYYEVTMKPIKNNGVVSSFFTYTGPSDHNPWDEIDIEFLGKDTSIVQFNYFTNGAGEHEYVYSLGFDAAEDFHSYGFDWQEDSITWYVDGEAVYSATENIPGTPGKIMMNTWPGKGVADWLNPFDGTVPLTAEYTNVSYSNKSKAG